MAQVAVYESLGSYGQFLEPPQPPKNVDLYNLYANTNGAIAAKWPIESQKPGGLSDGGSHIGLIQTMTDPNQTVDPNAWNWSTNGSDGVNLFSGTPPSEYSDAENKIQHATDYENIMIQEYIPGSPPSLKLPPLSGSNLENMALVLYGPAASNDPTRQYHIPVCLPPGTVVYNSATSTYACVGGTWQWAVNSTGNPGGVNYADGADYEKDPSF
jgi:hypothetical protein